MTIKSPFAGEREIALLIDHTLLKPEATGAEIAVLCQQALEFEFASVCVNPCRVKQVHSKLSGSSVRTCCVVGFPLGANRSGIKVEEARTAMDEGASELDMVMNIGALRSGDSKLVGAEIGLLAEAAHAGGAVLKVILEMCLLTHEEKLLACTLAKEAGADFVKTSTGFSKSGATEADVSLMRACVGGDIGVKASGGVRTLDAVTKMVQAGANRIGTSSGVQIVGEFRAGVIAAGALPGAGAGDNY